MKANFTTPGEFRESLKAYQKALYPTSSPKRYGERLSKKNHGRKGGKKR